MDAIHLAPFHQDLHGAFLVFPDKPVCAHHGLHDFLNLFRLLLDGFEVGADDYITKPIKPRVFISRVKALLRRVQSTADAASNQEFGNVRIDKEKHAVFIGDKEISLPKKEFRLLALLSSKPGKVFTREYILDQVWGDEVVVGDRTIDVHIRKLREKIGEEYFKTVKGVGYKFEF